MKKRFHITYEVVTPASAANGDAAYRGFLPKSKEVPLYRNNMPKTPALFTLRDAVELLESNGGRYPIESDSSHGTPRWLTATGSQHGYETREYFEKGEGADIGLSMHLERACTDASARRIAKLLGVKIR